MAELLGVVFISLPFLGAFLLAVLLIVLFTLSYQRFGFGLGLVAVTSWLDGATQSAPVLQLGLRWYIADLPLLVLGAVTALRWLVARDMPRRHLGWLLFVLVFFGNLAWGLATRGTAAGVQARGDFYAVVAASYAMSFPIERVQVRALMRTMLLFAGALGVLTVYRWVVYFGHIADLLPPGGVYNIDGPIRVIGSQHALVLAQALLLGLYFAQLSGAGAALRVLSPLLLGMAVALQHRSVWLAGLVGVGASMVLARAERMPLWQQLAAAGAMVVLVAAGVMFSGRLGQDVMSSAQRAAAGQGTVAARFDNWRATLTDWRSGGARSVLVGRPLGSDTTRFVSDEAGRTVKIGFGAHNNYVSQLVGGGLLGFAGLLWAIASAVSGLWRQCSGQSEQSDWAAPLLVLLAMQLAYYVAYAVDFMQAAIFGMALAAAMQARSVPRAEAGRRQARARWA